VGRLVGPHRLRVHVRGRRPLRVFHRPRPTGLDPFVHGAFILSYGLIAVGAKPALVTS
jgi:hypothetical protein